MPTLKTNKLNRASLLLPISIIAVGVLLTALLLASPISEQVVAQDATATTSYPSGATATAQPNNSTAAPTNTTFNPYPNGTPTPTPQSSSSTNTPQPTNTSSSGGSSGGGGGTNQQTTSTPTNTNTATTQTTNSPTPQPTTDPGSGTTPTGTTEPTIDTGTAGPTIDPRFLACFPGTITSITGQGPPNQELILLFNERPVGGGFADAQGNYNLQLTIAQEQPGSHLVEIRLRRTYQLLDERICVIPTPTPRLRP